MKEVFQGDILHVEGVRGDIFVASTNRFNQTGMVIGCPVFRDGEPGALHIEVNGKDVHGIVACEQLKALDLSSRGYGKVDEVPIADIMEISDAVQGIFDYVY